MKKIPTDKAWLHGTKCQSLRNMKAPGVEGQPGAKRKARCGGPSLSRARSTSAEGERMATGIGNQSPGGVMAARHEVPVMTGVSRSSA